MRRQGVTFLVMMLFWTMSCEDSVPPVVEPQLFPLADGNIWVYSDGYSDTASAIVSEDTRTWFRINGNAFPAPGSPRLFRYDEAGRLIMWTSAGETVALDPSWPIRAPQILNLGFAGADSDRATVTIISKSLVEELPTGELASGCYLIQFVVRQSTGSNWRLSLAPGIGTVHKRETESGDAFLDSYDLYD